MERQILNQELGRFFQVAKKLNYEKCYMPSGIIDEYWHELLKTPSDYINFSVTNTGEYVEHLKGGGLDELEWVKIYEEMFGQLNKVWFMNSTGKVDNILYSTYLNTNKVYASWDCGPIVPDMGKKINEDLEYLRKIKELNDLFDKINEKGEGEKIPKIDEDTFIENIKKKIDKFNIDEIKKRNNID